MTKAKAIDIIPTLEQIMKSYRTMTQAELEKAFQEWRVEILKTGGCSEWFEDWPADEDI